MGKIIIFLGLLSTLFGDVIIIKEDGTKQEIKIKQDGLKYEVTQRFNKFRYTNQSDILVKFQDVTPEKVSIFEKKYNLKLKQILVIGYYIYEIRGDINTLIQQIANEPNIVTVKPDWSLQDIKKY